MSEVTEKWIIEDTLKLLLQVSRIFGSAPVRFESNNNNYSTVRISRFFHFYSILLASVVNISNIYYFFVSLYNQDKDLKNYYHLAFCDAPSFIFLVAHYSMRVFPLIVAAIYCCHRIKRILCCYSHILQIRRSINNICRSDIKKWKVLTLLIISIIGEMILMCCDMWVTRKVLIYYIYKFMVLNMWMIMECQFAFVATYANSAFKDINKTLEEILYILEVDENTPRTRIPNLVRQLCESFTSTCKVLNELYSSNNIYSFLYITFTVIGLETIILQIYQAMSPFDLLKITLVVIWGFYHIFRIMLILEPCHRTQNETLYTKILVGQLMCHQASNFESMIDVMDTFYKQLLLNKVTASALDVFPLNRSTLSLVIGAATTIFMIRKYMK